MERCMEITAEQRDLMSRHLELVIKANEKVNLTRVDTFESGKILHIEDSLSALDEFEKAPAGPYADLGSGGGYPGVVLSIATGRDVLLVDSVSKKMSVLDGIISQLGLGDQVSTYKGRIESLSIEQPSGFSVLTARALTGLASLIELASPLLCRGGIIICYKSVQYEEELEHALSIQDKLGMKHVSTRVFSLSDGTPRSIIVFEKIGEPLVKLPRRPGMAQKRPYK